MYIQFTSSAQRIIVLAFVWSWLGVTAKKHLIHYYPLELPKFRNYKILIFPLKSNVFSLKASLFSISESKSFDDIKLATYRAAAKLFFVQKTTNCMFMIYWMLRALLNKPIEISFKKFIKHRSETSMAMKLFVNR